MGEYLLEVHVPEASVVSGLLPGICILTRDRSPGLHPCSFGRALAPGPEVRSIRLQLAAALPRRLSIALLGRGSCLVCKTCTSRNEEIAGNLSKPLPLAHASARWAKALYHSTPMQLRTSSECQQ